MLKIGLTGGIGSGKSLVARIFNELYRIPVFYADNEAKIRMNSDDELRAEIIELLGQQSYTQEGNLNKPYIAKAIFNNHSMREELNKRVHRKVKDSFKTWLEKQTSEYILHEAAIMIESGFYEQMNQLITVQANETIRINRIRERDNLSKEQILQRMEAQLSDEERKKYADYVITNDNTHSVVSQIKNIHLKILAHG